MTPNEYARIAQTLTELHARIFHAQVTAGEDEGLMLEIARTRIAQALLTVQNWMAYQKDISTSGNTNT